MKIIKRDGTIVDYDPEKIRIAIGKANEEVSKKDKVSKEQIKEIINYIGCNNFIFFKYFLLHFLTRI